MSSVTAFLCLSLGEARTPVPTHLRRGGTFAANDQ